MFWKNISRFFQEKDDRNWPNDIRIEDDLYTVIKNKNDEICHNEKLFKEVLHTLVLINPEERKRSLTFHFLEWIQSKRSAKM